MRWYDRLGRSSEIAFVRKRGRHIALATLSVYVAPAVGGRTRVCVSVSKAVGCAVVRNLVRRRIRGALDALQRPMRDARVLFVLKPAAAAVPFDRLASDVSAALRLLGQPT